MLLGPAESTGRPESCATSITATLGGGASDRRSGHLRLHRGVRLAALGPAGRRGAWGGDVTGPSRRRESSSRSAVTAKPQRSRRRSWWTRRQSSWRRACASPWWRVTTRGTARVVYLFTSGPPDTRVELHLAVEPDHPTVPTLSRFLSRRPLRASSRTLGITPLGHPQPRRLVLHQPWPRLVPHASGIGTPRWCRCRGISLRARRRHRGLRDPGRAGPCRADRARPFRFWVVGETILRIKARLWFVHKGVERFFEGRQPEAGLELAERIRATPPSGTPSPTARPSRMRGVSRCGQRPWCPRHPPRAGACATMWPISGRCATTPGSDRQSLGPHPTRAPAPAQCRVPAPAVPRRRRPGGARVRRLPPDA